MSELQITWHPQRVGDDPLQGLRVDQIMVLRAVAAGTPSHPEGSIFIGRVITHVNGIPVSSSSELSEALQRSPGRAVIRFGGEGKASPKQQKLQQQMRSVKGPGPPVRQPQLSQQPQHPQQPPPPKTALPAKTPVGKKIPTQPSQQPAPKTQLAAKTPLQQPVVSLHSKSSKPLQSVKLPAPLPAPKPQSQLQTQSHVVVRPAQKDKKKKKRFNYASEIQKLKNLNDVIEDMGSALVRYELGYVKTRCPSSHLLEPCTGGTCNICGQQGNGLGCRICDWDICWRCSPEHVSDDGSSDTGYQVSLHSMPRDVNYNHSHDPYQSFYSRKRHF